MKTNWVSAFRVAAESADQSVHRSPVYLPYPTYGGVGPAAGAQEPTAVQGTHGLSYGEGIVRLYMGG